MICDYEIIKTLIETLIPKETFWQSQWFAALVGGFVGFMGTGFLNFFHNKREDKIHLRDKREEVYKQLLTIIIPIYNSWILTDAILASCSAPTYFDPHCVGSYLLADGGLWANNPSLVAVIDAKKRLGQKLEDIKVLSIGTGLYKPEFDFKSKLMGFLTGWKGSRLMDFILSLQSQSTDNYLSLLLKENQKYRINFESSEELPLDKSLSVHKLIAKADEDFTYNTQNLKSFLELKE